VLAVPARFLFWFIPHFLSAKRLWTVSHRVDLALFLDAKLDFKQAGFIPQALTEERNAEISHLHHHERGAALCGLSQHHQLRGRQRST
jgi:hypothetical protein